MYEYNAVLVKVVDGDTIDVNVDLGMDTHVYTRLRLAGLNAAEHGTTAGDKATAFVIEWFIVNPAPYRIVTTKDKREKYGRYLADVYCGSTWLNGALLASGNALPWDGKGTRPV